MENHNNKIQRIVCKINDNDFNDFKNKLNLSDENLFDLISRYTEDKSAGSIEKTLNSFNIEIIYDVKHNIFNNEDLYEIIIINSNPNASIGNEIEFDSLEEYKMRNYSKDLNHEEILNNPNASAMIDLLTNMAQSEIDKPKLEERNVEEPKTYDIENIEDILNIITTDNVDYLLHDFTSFIKSYLTLKETIKLTNDYLPTELKEELGGDKNLKIENMIETPKSFNWIDDGKLNSDLSIQCHDPETNENYMDIIFKNKNGEISFNVEDKSGMNEIISQTTINNIIESLSNPTPIEKPRTDTEDEDEKSDN